MSKFIIGSKTLCVRVSLLIIPDIEITAHGVCPRLKYFSEKSALWLNLRLKNSIFSVKDFEKKFILAGFFSFF